MSVPTPFITVSNDRGIRFSLPADLNCITTYVLLEQERWFEKEVDFIYRFASPGMTALDIGANVGVYTLPLAKLLGPAGHVVAYEPGNVNRQHLERSLAMNHCDNVLVSSAALSDFSGTGMLHIDCSGELNQLVIAPTGTEKVESVEVSTLDHELERYDWARLDFMKIDAEGQEAAIIRGSRRFFERYSPLIMFEIKHASVMNYDLLEAFEALGFGSYRLIGDGSMLVPVDSLDQLDSFELNLFAARPEQARQLAKAGLLGFGGASAELSATERSMAIAQYCALPFAQALEIGAADIGNCPFGPALIAYAAYRFLPSLSSDKRLALIQLAYKELLDYCETNNSAAALSTLSRVALDLGHRGTALAVLQHWLDADLAEFAHPFFPPSLRFEQIGNLAADKWFVDAIKETLEVGSSFSSMFGHDLSRLEWLVARQTASDEIARRLLLIRVRTGAMTATPPVIRSEFRNVEIPHDADWLAMVRSLANET